MSNEHLHHRKPVGAAGSGACREWRMQDLTESLVELIRLTATDLSPDVEQALMRARDREEAGSAARTTLETILRNVELARAKSAPICQDTGTPIFYVTHPTGWSTAQLRQQIRSALAQATALSYMRPNAVHAISGQNSGNNLGDDAFPSIHLEEVDSDTLTVQLMLKGGGSENVSAQYSLPHDRLNAGRDLEGVRRVVLDAIHKAQGQGCPPGIIGVAIGGDRGSSYDGAKKALLRRTDEANPDPKLDALEKQIAQQANQMGIGPMGFSGKTTVLAVKIRAMYRHPACYFVSIAYMCWADRRHQMIVRGDQVSYE